MAASTTVNDQTTQKEERILGLVDCHSALVRSGLGGWSDARRALNMQAVGAIEFREALLELERAGLISLIFDGEKTLTGIVPTAG